MARNNQSKKQRHSHHLLFWGILVAIIGIAPFAIIDASINHQQKQQAQSLDLLATPHNATLSHKELVDLYQTDSNEIVIGWVGDIAPDTEATAETFRDVAFYLKQPDIMLGNFEGVITDESLTDRRCIPNDSWCWIFRGDTDFLTNLKKIGFDAFNFANNHMYDYGTDGYNQTIQTFKEESIPLAGNDKMTLFQHNNITIGIIGAYLHGRSDYSQVAATISQTQPQADIIIAMMHGGEEGAHAHTVTGNDEWHKGGYRGNMQSFAYQAIDAGADLVLGSGPHVVRGIEYYNNKLIAYSLGNFYGQEFSTHDILSSSGILNVTLTNTGDTVGANLVPLSIDEQGVPHLDHTRKSIELISEFSHNDFKENGLIFNGNGFKI
jgi:hypothetical protein